MLVRRVPGSICLSNALKMIGALVKTLHRWYAASIVSCQKGPTRHAYAWQIGPSWQDTIDMKNTFYYQIWHYLSRTIKDEAESAAWVLWLHNSDCLISDSAPSENWKLMHDIGKLIVLLRHRAIDIYGGTLDNGNLWWAVGQVIIMAPFDV